MTWESEAIYKAMICKYGLKSKSMIQEPSHANLRHKKSLANSNFPLVLL
jgi:hypothetical protein